MNDDIWQSLFLNNKDGAAYSAYAEIYKVDLETASKAVFAWWIDQSAWFYAPSDQIVS